MHFKHHFFFFFFKCPQMWNSPHFFFFLTGSLKRSMVNRIIGTDDRLIEMFAAVTVCQHYPRLGAETQGCVDV